MYKYYETPDNRVLRLTNTQYKEIANSNLKRITYDEVVRRFGKLFIVLLLSHEIKPPYYRLNPYWS
jgi:hypothetical protein